MHTDGPPDPDHCPNTTRKHDWQLADVRTLQGVRPPATVKDWVCFYCHARKQTEAPLI